MRTYRNRGDAGLMFSALQVETAPYVAGVGSGSGVSFRVLEVEDNRGSYNVVLNVRQLRDLVSQINEFIKDAPGEEQDILGGDINRSF